MRKKSITLLELIIAVSLLAVILLGVSAFDVAGRSFLMSSERRSQVLNEQTFILEHLSKNINNAAGDAASPGIVISKGGGVSRLDLRHEANDTPGNYSDDDWVRYEFISNSHEMRFYPDAGDTSDFEVLSSRVVAFDFDFFPSSSSIIGIVIDDLRIRYDPAKVIKSRDNPEGVLSNLELVSFSHSAS